MQLSNGERLLHWPLNKHVLTCGMYTKEGKLHAAIDMRAGVGTPVYAAESGYVEQIYHIGNEKPVPGKISSYGNFIKIKHDDYKAMALETCYAHLKDILVFDGQHVEEGQLIGHTGNTGITSGPHLHFEVRLRGLRRNPLVWLDDDFTKAWDTVFTYQTGEHAVKRPKVCPACGKEL